MPELPENERPSSRHGSASNRNELKKKVSLTIFTNNFITTLLGIFPHERYFFTLGLGPIIGPKNAVEKSLNNSMTLITINTRK
jgi:hypothetical protein